MRPKFEDIKSYEEFRKYYWYRDELKKICKSLEIDDSGMKTELNRAIEEYFKGNKIVKQCDSKRTKIVEEGVSLDTKLLESGFCCNQKFRDFFGAQTGSSHFKFTVDMVATAKEVRKRNDESFTLGDMLDVYYGTRVYAKYDSSSCEWNKFLKDFCADERNRVYSNKLKVASILWGKVRSSTEEKVYTRDWVERYYDEIKDYIKESEL